MMECGNCLQPTRLALPVRYDTMFARYTVRECLACRLGFDRAAVAHHTARLEGRHNLPGAWPVPCSWLALEARDAAMRRSGTGLRRSPAQTR